MTNFVKNMRIGKQVSISASSMYANKGEYLEWTKTSSNLFLVRNQPIFSYGTLKGI
jgi:hypothetical protein